MNNNIKKNLPDNMPGFIRSGALSGLVSTLIFTVTHQIFIADIWFPCNGRSGNIVRDMYNRELHADV